MTRKSKAQPDYGCRVNINEPPFDELYVRFKKWKGIPKWCPLSDDERREFESYFIKEQGNE